MGTELTEGSIQSAYVNSITRRGTLGLVVGANVHHSIEGADQEALQRELPRLAGRELCEEEVHAVSSALSLWRQVEASMAWDRGASSRDLYSSAVIVNALVKCLEMKDHGERLLWLLRISTYSVDLLGENNSYICQERLNLARDISLLMMNYIGDFPVDRIPAALQYETIICILLPTALVDKLDNDFAMVLAGFTQKNEGIYQKWFSVAEGAYARWQDVR